MLFTYKSAKRTTCSIRFDDHSHFVQLTLIVLYFRLNMSSVKKGYWILFYSILWLFLLCFFSHLVLLSIKCPAGVQFIWQDNTLCSLFFFFVRLCSISCYFTQILFDNCLSCNIHRTQSLFYSILFRPPYPASSTDKCYVK